MRMLSSSQASRGRYAERLTQVHNAGPLPRISDPSPPPPVRSAVSALHCILCVARDAYCQQMSAGTSRCRAAAFEAGENIPLSHSQERGRGRGRGRQCQCMGNGVGFFPSSSSVLTEHRPSSPGAKCWQSPSTHCLQLASMSPLVLVPPTDRLGWRMWRGGLEGTLYWRGLPRAAGLGVGGGEPGDNGRERKHARTPLPSGS